MRKALKAENSILSKFLITSLIISVLGLGLGRLILTNILATSGQRLAAANQKIDLLKEENQDLENQISIQNSLAKVEAFAEKTKLVKTTNVLVLTPNSPVAHR